jgi:hypothetical protein
MMHVLKQKINNTNTLVEPVNQIEMDATMDVHQNKKILDKF